MTNPTWSAQPARTAARDFPLVELASRLEADDSTVSVELQAWQNGEVDFYWLDAKADALGERGLVPIAACGEPSSRLELLTRCQRWLDRRNRNSRCDWFDALIAFHRSLYDRAKPMVRAEHNHALDTWQWALRLDPDASAPIQVAALFHHVERAEGGADFLAGAPLPGDLARRSLELIDASDAPESWQASGNGDLGLLEDADSLSFFSLESSRYFDDEGAASTTRKIAWSMRRLSLRACACLPAVRLRRDVAGLLGASPASMTG